MKYKHNNTELISYWDEQIHFLSKSAKEYDNGDEIEAKRMATSLRILFHNTNKSHSLFKQLNEKNLKSGFIFLSSSSMYIPANLLSSWLLGSVSITNGIAMYKPIGLNTQDLHLLNFNDWWNEVIFDDKKYKLTRKDIILFISNQDGGAHVDPCLDKRYAAIVKYNSLGWCDGNGQPINGNPAYAAIRQIVDEVLASNNIYFKKLSSKKKVINREFDMVFIDENRRFPWATSNEDSLLGSIHRREKRKAYIQKYTDGTRIPILTL